MSEQLSRRGLPVYRTNPSIPEALTSMKTGIKRISNPSGNEMIISNSHTGEVVTGVDVGFHQRIKVDKTQFVKLYIQGVSAFVGLTKAGAKALEMVISESSINTGKDTLFISPRIGKEIYNISKPTFMRGMKELLENGILYEHIEDNWYFININFMFNGDRLAFLKTYELTDFSSINEEPDQKTLPHFEHHARSLFDEDI